MARGTERTSSWRAGGSFALTRWSVVLAAAGPASRSRRRRALGELARINWYPLYAFIRRQGAPHEQAEDLTQGFFARLLEKEGLAAVAKDKGRFRSFLLAAVKHFLSNERDKARAIKRGGGTPPLSLDLLAGESHYAAEPADRMTPEKAFDRRWALAVLDEVLARLRREYAQSDRRQLFEALEPALAAEADAPSHAEVARKLGMTEGAVKVAAHRLRKRYRELLREEIAQTVDGPELVDEEIRYLLQCL